MNREDGQVYSVVYCNFLVLLSTTLCSQNINKQNVKIADETLTNYSFSVGITKLNQINIWKDDIEFVTEFPCLLGHPVNLFVFNAFKKQIDLPDFLTLLQNK